MNKDSQILFEVNHREKYVIITFKTSNSSSILAPRDLRNLIPPSPLEHDFAHKGVIISGKGPIWLYGFLVHFYHPTKWVATYDPRLQGAVVVETHSPTIQVGTVVPIEPSTLI